MDYCAHKTATLTSIQHTVMGGHWSKEVFRTCNVLPFSCTHLALWQGKRPKVHAKQKGFKNFFRFGPLEEDKFICMTRCHQSFCLPSKSVENRLKY